MLFCGEFLGIFFILLVIFQNWLIFIYKGHNLNVYLLLIIIGILVANVAKSERNRDQEQAESQH